MVGISRATECFANPVFPDDDGLELLPWTGTDCLTYEGEINKMAVNVAFGRQMCGVHYRMDSEEGLRLGELVGVRMLQQVPRILQTTCKTCQNLSRIGCLDAVACTSYIFVVKHKTPIWLNAQAHTSLE